MDFIFSLEEVHKLAREFYTYSRKSGGKREKGRAALSLLFLLLGELSGYTVEELCRFRDEYCFEKGNSFTCNKRKKGALLRKHLQGYVINREDRAASQVESQDIYRALFHR